MGTVLSYEKLVKMEAGVEEGTESGTWVPHMSECRAISGNEMKSECLNKYLMRVLWAKCDIVNECNLPHETTGRKV
jgi:hypothetical protein